MPNIIKNLEDITDDLGDLLDSITTSKKSIKKKAIVVDVKDPKERGRVKVRIAGVHKPAKYLPDEKLPWTIVQQQTGSGQGIGKSINLHVGQWVEVVPLNKAQSKWQVIGNASVTPEEAKGINALYAKGDITAGNSNDVGADFSDLLKDFGDYANFVGEMAATFAPVVDSLGNIINNTEDENGVIIGGNDGNTKTCDPQDIGCLTNRGVNPSICSNGKNPKSNCDLDNSVHPLINTCCVTKTSCGASVGGVPPGTPTLPELICPNIDRTKTLEFLVPRKFGQTQLAWTDQFIYNGQALSSYERNLTINLLPGKNTPHPGDIIGLDEFGNELYARWDPYRNQLIIPPLVPAGIYHIKYSAVMSNDLHANGTGTISIKVVESDNPTEDDILFSQNIVEDMSGIISEFVSWLSPILNFTVKEPPSNIDKTKYPYSDVWVSPFNLITTRKDYTLGNVTYSVTQMDEKNSPEKLSRFEMRKESCLLKSSSKIQLIAKKAIEIASNKSIDMTSDVKTNISAPTIQLKASSGVRIEGNLYISGDIIHVGDSMQTGISVVEGGIVVNNSTTSVHDEDDSIEPESRSITQVTASDEHEKMKKIIATQFPSCIPDPKYKPNDPNYVQDPNCPTGYYKRPANYPGGGCCAVFNGSCTVNGDQHCNGNTSCSGEVSCGTGTKLGTHTHKDSTGGNCSTPV